MPANKLRYQFQSINLMDDGQARHGLILPIPQIVSVLIILVLILAGITFFQLYKKSRAQSELSLLKQKNQLLIEKHALGQGDQKILGVLSNTQHRMMTGFEPYLLTLARHHVDGLWLNHFSINLNNQHIDLKGEAFVATHVQQLLSNLQQFKPFAQTPFSIEHIAHNSMQKEKQSKSSPQVASLYHFSLINYTPKTNKNGGKK